MATWITHIRIAEQLMKKHQQLNNQLFLVGNIAPDCGQVQSDGTYLPPKEITHWKIGKGKYDLEGFHDKYLSEINENSLFYLGYYFHLITDIEWIKTYKKQLELNNLVVKNKQVMQEYKNDWYGQDFLYLKNNNDSIFYTEFIKIKEFSNVYFENYAIDTFTNQIKTIQDYYLNDTSLLGRKFLILTKKDMDIFIEKMVIILEEYLTKIINLINM